MPTTSPVVSAESERAYPAEVRPETPVQRAGEPPKGNTAVATGLVVEEVKNLEALGALEPAWQALADHASEPNPFYEPWMALPALDQLGARNVRFICVFAQDPLRPGERVMAGLFPFEEVRGPLGITYLRSWMHRYCYLGAPLVGQGQERAVIAALFGWMNEAEQSRQLVRLELLPADGALRRAITDEVWERQWPLFLAEASTRAYFRPAATAEAFINGALKNKRRREVRRQRSRLGETGRLEFTELQDPAQVREWADEYIELESRGWKGREQVSVGSRARDVQFFRDILRHAALRDRLMMLALRLDGRAVAMKVNLLSPNGGSFAMKIAYDESFARYSPGVQLELENIARLHQRTDVAWMDSCASPNRWMVNHLWGDRREFHSLVIAADRPLPSALMTLLPVARWMKRWIMERAPVARIDHERASSRE